MADATLALAAAFIIIAANVFLYYRWRDLKDQYEETQNSKRVGSAKNIFSEVSVKRSYSSVSAGSEESLLDEARSSVGELKRIIDEDVVQLHQKMVSSSQRVTTSHESNAA